MGLTPKQNQTHHAAARRPPTVHGQSVTDEQARRGLELARRAVWLALEEFGTREAHADLVALAGGDRVAARVAQDHLAFTTMSVSSRSQARAFFLIGDVRGRLDRQPERGWIRRTAARLRHQPV